MLYFRYLSFKFLKSFFIILLSLEMFFVGVDFLVKSDEIPSSANLVTLFFFYDAMYAANFLIPISLIITHILYQYSINTKNEMIAFCSLGYSKKDIFLPTFISSIAVIILFIFLQTTDFAYAKEKIDELSYGGIGSKTKTDFFVKFENDYVYFQKFYPLLKKAEGIKLYEMDGGKVKRLVSAKEGYFVDNSWLLKVVSETNIKDNENSEVLIKQYESKKEIEGFKAELFEKVYDMHGSIGLIDAFRAIGILQEQNISIDRVTASIFMMILSPFIPLFVGSVSFFFLPISRRNGNVLLHTLISLFAGISLWGLFFIIGRLSIGGMAKGEFLILTPFAILFLVSIFFYNKIK